MWRMLQELSPASLKWCSEGVRALEQQSPADEPAHQLVVILGFLSLRFSPVDWNHSSIYHVGESEKALWYLIQVWCSVPQNWSLRE